MDFVAQLHINVYFKSGDVKVRKCEPSLMLESAGGKERMKANAVAIFKHVLVLKKSV